LSVAVIAQMIGNANSTERKRLDLGPGDHVVRVLRVRRDSDRPHSCEMIVLPLGRFPGLPPDREIVSDIIDLARLHGVTLGTATERLRTVRASRSVAGLLGLRRGARVRRIDRITRSADGLPLEWRIAYLARS
jgi:GntR family transcriptional regulator